jgi:NitT/TauT family transport system permease protein
VRRSVLLVVLPPVVTLAILGGVWEACVRLFGVAAFLLPPPSTVLVTMAREAPSLLGATLTTAEGAVLGFAMSAVLGIAAGVVLSLSRVVERGLYPYALFLQTVPIVAIAPLLVLWFGPGLHAVSVSAFIVSVFPVVAGTLSGIRSVDPRLEDMFRLYGATRWARLVKLELPSAARSVLTGLRVASGLATIGAIVGEFVAGFSEGNAGLGITVLSAYRQLRTDLLFAAVALAALLGLLIFGAVGIGSAILLRRMRARA